MMDLDWSPLLYALGLLVLGFALLITEFFIVSFGLISVAALACAGTAIYYAFQVSTAVGFGFIGFAGLTAIVTIRWGLRRVRSSSAVPKAQVTGDAGYHHVAQRLGIAVGSTGVLVTPARPSGRAAFGGGECDVQTRNRALERNTRIVVEHIDGPIIFVKQSDKP